MVAILLAVTMAASDQEPIQPPLIQAILKSDVTLTGKLLAGGADPNTRNIPSEFFRNKGVLPIGEPALTVAVIKQSLPIVKLLLDYKADVNAKGDAGFTALFRAAANDSPDIVKLLIHRGALVNLQNDYQDTAIIFATSMDNARNLEILIRAGADKNGGSGTTPLILAAQGGYEKAIKALLANKADPNFRRAGFWTPLEYAIANDYEKIASMLRKAGGKGRTKKALDKESADESAKWDAQIALARKARIEKYGSLAKLVPEDRPVIEATLKDLMDFAGKDAPSVTLGDGNRSSGIVLIDRSSDMAPLEEDPSVGVLNPDIEEQMEINLFQRNCRTVSFKELALSDQRVRLKPKAESSGMFSEEFFAMLSLPGYANDGQSAAIRVSFGPTAHGAGGTFWLKKQDKKWIVARRRIGYHL